MKRIKNEKGITLIELTITIVILLILAGITTTLGISSILELRDFDAVKSDIIELTEAVQTYYLENEKLPLEDETLKIDFTPPEDNKNPNDSGEYYEIDTSLLENVTLQKKRRTYLVDKQSLTVYCKEGVEYQGKTYYTILDNDDTSNYYNQIDQPIISAVIFESNNNINKYWATTGDTVTLKFFTNYDVEATVTINGEKTEVTWDANKRIGKATYTITEVTNPDTNLPFTIKLGTGAEITKPTSSDGITLKVNTWEIMKVTLNTEAVGNGTINGGTPNSNNPIIPRGYKPINVQGTSTSVSVSNWGGGTNPPSQSAIDSGLVITDSKNNEWVWVPVDTDTLNKLLASSSGESMSGSVGVTTKLYTKTATIGRTGDTATITRVKPGSTSGYREPDLADKYDSTEAYYKTIMGYDSPKAMAEAFALDYKEMIESIKKYGGFYIGRYELSSDGVQKGKAVLVNTDWYNLYKKCTELNASEKVKSRMIYGIQWDLACDFISKKGDKKSITNSTTWGNYSDSTGNAATSAGSKRTTGYSNYWKANNIYDLAGNCWEWTQEGNGTSSRAFRGGNYGHSGATGPASNYSNYGVFYTNSPALRNKTSINNKVKKACKRITYVLKYNSVKTLFSLLT